jgi:SAM-dependent methyltransferase
MNYRCVLCGLELEPTSEKCGRCCGWYPEAGGVRVLVHDARGTLADFRNEMLAGWRDVEVLRRGAGSDRSSVERGQLEQLVMARAANQAVLESLYAQLGPMREATTEPAFGDFLRPHFAGWRLERMLFDNFCRDWANTRGFREACGLVLDAAARHETRRQCAVVLGCGAGRLVRALADSYEQSIGLDLSLAALLLARRLLGGESVEVYLERFGSAPVTLHGATERSDRCQLDLADAADVPLADGSASLVVAQDLLDLVLDARNVAREANRLLGPGGIWISLGLPFQLARDPLGVNRREVGQMPQFLAEHGFEAIELAEWLHRFPADFELALPARLRLVGDDGFPGPQRRSLFFAARKTTALPVDAPAAAFRAYFAGHTAELRAMGAGLVPGSQIRLTRGTEFGAGPPRAVQELTLGDAPSQYVSDAEGVRIQALLLGLQARRSVDDLIRAMDGVPEREVVLVLRALAKLGLVELGEHGATTGGER